MNMKNFACLICFILLLTGCSAPEAAPETTAETIIVPTEAPLEETVEVQPAEERYMLTFVGDCTLGASPVNYYAGVGFIQTIGADYGYPFRNVLSYFENDEATFANLEGPLTDSETPAQKKHTFRGPRAYGKILTDSSVEAVSIANNHIQDYGQTGHASTVETLRSAGVSFVERDDSCMMTTENGLKIGVYGAVYYQLDTESITAAVASLKEAGCDLVIFAPHWGVEGAYRPTEDQVALAHAVIDAGADIVWGSHPHVLQPVEHYQGGVIYYSLGNFSFGGNAYPRDYDTVLIRQEVIREEDGTVKLGELSLIPASVSSATERNNYQPTPYEPGSEEYKRVLRKLHGTWDGPNLPIE